VFALLASVVGMQMSAIHHELTVRHAVCAEHGELIDVEGFGPASVAPAAPSHDSQLLTTGDAPFSGHHQHCAFVSASHSRSVVKKITPVTSARSTTNRLTLELHSTPLVSTVLYLSAPKHSPPAA
jgi:hypothetical protein